MCQALGPAPRRGRLGVVTPPLEYAIGWVSQREGARRDVCTRSITSTQHTATSRRSALRWRTLADECDPAMEVRQVEECG